MRSWYKPTQAFKVWPFSLSSAGHKQFPAHLNQLDWLSLQPTWASGTAGAQKIRLVQDVCLGKGVFFSAGYKADLEKGGGKNEITWSPRRSVEKSPHLNVSHTNAVLTFSRKAANTLNSGALPTKTSLFLSSQHLSSSLSHWKHSVAAQQTKITTKPCKQEPSLDSIWALPKLLCHTVRKDHRSSSFQLTTASRGWENTS